MVVFINIYQHKERNSKYIIERIIIKAPLLFANCKSLGKTTRADLIPNELLNWQSSIANYYDYLVEYKIFKYSQFIISFY